MQSAWLAAAPQQSQAAPRRCFRRGLVWRRKGPRSWQRADGADAAALGRPRRLDAKKLTGLPPRSLGAGATRARLDATRARLCSVLVSLGGALAAALAATSVAAGARARPSRALHLTGAAGASTAAASVPGLRRTRGGLWRSGPRAWASCRHDGVSFGRAFKKDNRNDNFRTFPKWCKLRILPCVFRMRASSFVQGSKKDVESSAVWWRFCSWNFAQGKRVSRTAGQENRRSTGSELLFYICGHFYVQTPGIPVPNINRCNLPSLQELAFSDRNRNHRDPRAPCRNLSKRPSLRPEWAQRTRTTQPPRSRLQRTWREATRWCRRLVCVHNSAEMQQIHSSPTRCAHQGRAQLALVRGRLWTVSRHWQSLGSWQREVVDCASHPTSILIEITMTTSFIHDMHIAGSGVLRDAPQGQGWGCRRVGPLHRHAARRRKAQAVRGRRARALAIRRRSRPTSRKISAGCCWELCGALVHHPGVADTSRLAAVRCAHDVAGVREQHSLALCSCTWKRSWVELSKPWICWSACWSLPIQLEPLEAQPTAAALVRRWNHHLSNSRVPHYSTHLGPNWCSAQLDRGHQVIGEPSTIPTIAKECSPCAANCKHRSLVLWLH